MPATHNQSQPDTSAAMDDMRDPEVAAAMRNEETMVTTQPDIASDDTNHIDWDKMAEERLGQLPRSEHGCHIPQTSPAPGCDSGSHLQHLVVKAVNNHDALVQFAEFIRDGYERTDINHVDFRVGAYKAALDVLASVVGGVPK